MLSICRCLEPVYITYTRTEVGEIKSGEPKVTVLKIYLCLTVGFALILFLLCSSAYDHLHCNEYHFFFREKSFSSVSEDILKILITTNMFFKNFCLLFVEYVF